MGEKIMQDAFLLDEKCQLTRVTQEMLNYCQPFFCGDEDLDDFFAHNTIAYEKELMGKSYCWVLREDVTKIVGMVTLANAGIQTTHMKNHPKRAASGRDALSLKAESAIRRGLRHNESARI